MSDHPKSTFARRVRAAHPRDKHHEVRDDAVPGLMLRVGKLLGRRRHRTTAGYAHLADGHLIETAEHVGSIIAEAMAAGVTWN